MQSIFFSTEKKTAIHLLCDVLVSVQVQGLVGVFWSHTESVRCILCVARDPRSSGCFCEGLQRGQVHKDTKAGKKTGGSGVTGGKVSKDISTFLEPLLANAL